MPDTPRENLQDVGEQKRIDNLFSRENRPIRDTRSSSFEFVRIFATLFLSKSLVLALRRNHF